MDFGPITRFDASETGISVAAESQGFAPLGKIFCSKKIRNGWKLIHYMPSILLLKR